MRRLIFSALFLVAAFFSFSASAQFSPDPGDMRDCYCIVPPPPPNLRTEIPASTFQQSRSMIMATSGQSMLGNFGLLTPYHPTSGQVYEFDPYTLKIYRVTDGARQTMGMNGWAGRTSVLPYWADQIVLSGKADRVLIVGHNVGGTAAVEWSPVGQWFHRSQYVLTQLAALGIPINLWIEMLGQADVDPANPNGAVSAQNWADLMAWKWAALNLQMPIIIGKGAHWTNVSNVHTTRYNMVRSGQTIAAGMRANATLGPDDDVHGDNLRVDGVHPADGMRAAQWTAWSGFIPKM